jgi:predicted transcriptional regulator
MLKSLFTKKNIIILFALILTSGLIIAVVIFSNNSNKKPSVKGSYEYANLASSKASSSSLSKTSSSNRSSQSSNSSSVSSQTSSVYSSVNAVRSSKSSTVTSSKANSSLASSISSSSVVEIDKKTFTIKECNIKATFLAKYKENFKNTGNIENVVMTDRTEELTNAGYSNLKAYSFGLAVQRESVSSSLACDYATNYDKVLSEVRDNSISTNLEKKDFCSKAKLTDKSCDLVTNFEAVIFAGIEGEFNGREGFLFKTDKFAYLLSQWSPQESHLIQNLDVKL